MKPKPKFEERAMLAGRLAADVVRKIAPQLAPGSKEHVAMWTAIIQAANLVQLCGLAVTVKDGWETFQKDEPMEGKIRAETMAYIELANALGWELTDDLKAELAAQSSVCAVLERSQSSNPTRAEDSPRERRDDTRQRADGEQAGPAAVACPAYPEDRAR